MLRVTTARDGNSTRFRLEGKLAGDWVEVMEQSWRQAVAESRNRSFLIDLTAITYIDSKGAQLLNEMYQQGAELKASTCLTKCIVEEIKSRSGHSGKVER